MNFIKKLNFKSVKQKTYLLSVLFIMILLSLYLAFFYNKTRYDESMQICIEDTSLIDVIYIIEATNRVKIAKLSNKWIVNDVYNANDNAIKRMLRVFKNIEINTLIPKSEHDSVINLLSKTGISVSFYKNNKQNTSYTIGEFDKTRNGTLLISDNKLPVYVSAPGLTADIHKFIESNAIFWRNKRIFDFAPDEINSITFIDYEKPDQSFNVELKDSSYEVFDQQHKPYNFDKEKVSRYISYFKNIEFESVAKELTTHQTDSIFAQKPVYFIKVKSNSGNEFDLKIFHIQLQNNHAQFNLDKAYGIINNQKPFIIIDYFAVDPIIKPINYFR